MKKLLSAFFDKRFLKFCLVGAANTLFGAGVMYAMRNLLPWAALGFDSTSSWPYWISSAGNYLFGSILSYFLNKYFTFRSQERGVAQVLRFAVNILLCYLVAYGAAKPLCRWLLGMAGVTATSAVDNISMLAGMVIFTGLNYLGQRFFAFKDAENTENGKKPVDKREKI